ncbi:alpha/beta fold hydrolase [Amaricoccus macauensis]|uniref:alpha/beta fold hydrolase n=1 Tax=Amaricoccus macauensis TaxID=57001 RepID=UPI003C7E255B
MLKILLVLLICLALAVAFVVWRLSERSASARANFPPNGQMIDVGGVEVHAYVAGEGPDLVLIHGAGGNLRDFTFDLTDRLTDRYRVIAFDRPGFGYTGHPPDADVERGESPREQARLLQAAADALGVTDPVVLGHSFGGAVAMAWALERPDATGALVVLGGATMPWPGDLDPLYGINASAVGGAIVVPLISAFATHDMAVKVLERVFAPDPVPAGYSDAFGIPLTLRRETQLSNARQVNGLRPHVVSMSESYAGLTVPVELVHGTADEIVPAEVHAIPLSGILPDAELTLLPGVGHMPHHAATGEVIAAIDRAAGRRRADARAEAASK